MSYKLTNRRKEERRVQPLVLRKGHGGRRKLDGSNDPRKHTGRRKNIELRKKIGALVNQNTALREANTHLAQLLEKNNIAGELVCVFGEF